MAYPPPWRNEGHFYKDMYCQKCRPDELKFANEKLLNLIEKYGSIFDDNWYYWLTKKGKICRIPLWLSNQKGVNCEKPRKYEPNRKLFP